MLSLGECRAETLEHIQKLRNYLNVIIKELLKRGEVHDLSKLESPEVEVFAEYTSMLKGLAYGSEEYEDNKLKMKVALDHHYANNRHHIQFHKNGIRDMNLIDVIEMFCDWKAATLRHDNGNLRFSIEKNCSDYHIPDELKEIFLNTVEVLS